MTKRERITRYTRVGEALRLLPIENIVARESDTLPDLAAKVVARPTTHTIVVLDDQGRLAGLIPVSQLVDDIFFHIVPEEFLPNKAGYEGLAKHEKEPSMTTAREIMHPPVWTSVNDTVKSAFTKMRQAGLSGLPVLQDARLVGYVDVLELLAAWLRAGRQ